jgi:hypothetical protein
MCLRWSSTTKINYRKWLTLFPFQSPPFWWLMPTQTKANSKCRNITSLQFRWMCIGYLELNQWKILHIWLRVNGLAFFCLIFWTRLAPLVLFLQIFWKSIQKLLQIVKGIGIWLQEAFSDLKFLPLFQMLFLWLYKRPPEWNSPLSFQEGFFEVDTN